MKQHIRIIGTTQRGYCIARVRHSRHSHFGYSVSADNYTFGQMVRLLTRQWTYGHQRDGRHL